MVLIGGLSIWYSLILYICWIYPHCHHIYGPIYPHSYHIHTLCIQIVCMFIMFVFVWNLSNSRIEGPSAYGSIVEVGKKPDDFDALFVGKYWIIVTRLDNNLYDITINMLLILIKL